MIVVSWECRPAQYFHLWNGSWLSRWWRWGQEGHCNKNPEFAATAAQDSWPESGSQTLGLQPCFSSQGFLDLVDTQAETYFIRFTEARMLGMNGRNVDDLYFQAGDHVPSPLPTTMSGLSSSGQCWPNNQNQDKLLQEARGKVMGGSSIARFRYLDWLDETILLAYLLGEALLLHKTISIASTLQEMTKIHLLQKANSLNVI